MATATQNRSAGALAEEANDVRKTWGWFLALGIVQIVAGMLAVSFAFTATLASVVMLGILLLVTAGAEMAAANWARNWRGFFLFLLLGIVYAAAGFVMLRHPLIAAESLTLMLAAAFLVAGVFRIVFALVERFPSWGWVLVNGIVTVLLGITILEQWPASGLWALGLLVGVDFIMNGVTWSMLAVGVRKGLAQFTGHQ
jgi:uncharacterized membrane protein HdeD (DUF308 family)